MTSALISKSVQIEVKVLLCESRTAHKLIPLGLDLFISQQVHQVRTQTAASETQTVDLTLQQDANNSVKDNDICITVAPSLVHFLLKAALKAIKDELL